MKEVLLVVLGIFATAGYLAYICLWYSVLNENKQLSLELLSVNDYKPGPRPKWITYYWITTLVLVLALVTSFDHSLHSKSVPHLCLLVLVPILSLITLGKQMNETPHWP